MALELLDQHRVDLSLIRDLAQRDLAALVQAIRSMSVAEAREALKAAIPDLMDPFLGAASESAAVVLEELYAASSVKARYVEQIATGLSPDRIDGLARWAVGPMVDETLDASVLSRLAGAVTRMIFDASRTQMVDGVERLPGGHRVHFQRFPRADCCAFCGLLASRPIYMSYTSEAAAGSVVGRGSTRTGLDANGKRLAGGVGGGIKARGSQAFGNRFHDDCRCVVGPLLPGSPLVKTATQTQERFQDLYLQAASENGRGARDLKATLREWRALHGTH